MAINRRRRRTTRQSARRFAAFSVAAMLVTVFTVTNAIAHFQLNVNLRIVHVVHEQDTVRLLVRVPMAYLVADKIGELGDDGLPTPAPYTRNRIEAGALVHELDAEWLRGAPQGLGKILADALVLEARGQRFAARVGRVRAYPAREQPPFATRDEAFAVFDGPVYADRFDETYVGDTVVDAELVYRSANPLIRYSLRSTLDPGLDRQDETANLILDHSATKPLVFRVRGLMTDPIHVSRSPWRAGWTFIVEGIRHILEGLDHVLFVFCLVLGASTLGALAWRVTGFTIGHSITLSLGFFGYVPSGGWFIPLIETGIAASIVYAAAIAVLRIEHRSTTVVTAALGLLHGLGFSFVLKTILNLDAPNLWQSLLAFNVGVEIGQLAIALCIWPLLWLIAQRQPNRMAAVRFALAVPCIVVAAIWIGQRGTLLIASL